MKFSLAFLLLAASVTAHANPKVIYGKDGRNDVYSYTNAAVVRVSRSTVVLVNEGKLSPLGELLKMDASTIYGEEYNLCLTERFRKQPSPGFCSGFLIAPNKIATAGHCIDSTEACEDVRFVFDYRMKNRDEANDTFSADQVYSCKKILGWDEQGNGADYAIIELDRPVVGRKPLKLSSNRRLRRGTPLLVIGHPAGMPTKITDGAAVRAVNKGLGFFVANLDTYGGNSGSAVFNEKTLEVEGILVRGEEDFTENEECSVSFQVGDRKGRGEDVTLISKAVENGFTDHSFSFIDTVLSTEVRYVWLEADQTCNEFRGNTYIQEVANELCGH